MSNSSNCQNQDCQCQSNSGFIFGLICGAIIGALIAVIIYKNSKTEVFQKLEQKIKSFFKDFTPKSNPADPKKSSSFPSLIVSPSKTTTEITPIFVKPKKTPPKMFVKPKR